MDEKGSCALSWVWDGDEKRQNYRDGNGIRVPRPKFASFLNVTC